MDTRDIFSVRLSRRDYLKQTLMQGLGLGFAGGIMLGGCHSRRKDRRPNIIFITVDTLRADHLGCYGYRLGTSPHIDAFAREGLLFKRCLSHAPVTGSSLISLLSGYLPTETKVYGNMFPPVEGLQTLAERLHQAGYFTAAVVSNFILRKNSGYEQGFEVYDDEMQEWELVRKFPERVAEKTAHSALQVLKRKPDRPVFLWVHFQDPHGPYTPPRASARLFYDSSRQVRVLEAKDEAMSDNWSGYKSIPLYQRLGHQRDYNYYLANYDGEIHYLDQGVHRVLEALKRMKMFDNSFILFSADHGESLGEHDYFFCHGENLYQELIHVPLIIRFGDQLRGSVDNFVQHIDVVPTVLNVVGASNRPNFRGHDLLTDRDTVRGIFSSMKRHGTSDVFKHSLVIDGHKLIESTDSGPELYDLRGDPEERENLIARPDFKSIGEQLSRQLDQVKADDRLGLKSGPEQKPRSLEELEKLKAMGYVE